MPRDLDAVLDGMGWQLDEAERADMHKLQVATLLAWGVHPDSIGPTRTGRARLAQTMAEALQRAGQAGGLEPGPHWPRRVPPRDPALAGMPERFTAAGVRDRVEWRGGPCPLPLGALVTVWTRGNTGELGAPWQISRNPAGSLDWSHGDVPLASDIVAFFAESADVPQIEGPTVVDVTKEHAEAVKVLQAWGYTWAGESWAPPARASFYVKRAHLPLVAEAGGVTGGVVLLRSLEWVNDPSEWVAAFAAPGPWVEGPEKAFLAEVLDEVLRARAKFPGDRVMGLALAEEFGELIKAVLDETPERVRREAVQTAAMCVRLVLDGDGSVKEWRAARGLAPLVQPKEGAA